MTIARYNKSIDISTRILHRNGRERGDTEVRAIFAEAAHQFISGRDAGEPGNVLDFLENAIDMLDSGEYLARYIKATDNAPQIIDNYQR